MSKEIKNKDYLKQGNESLNTAQDIIDQVANINGVPTRTGLFNTPINRTRFRYKAPSASRVKEKQGAYIVMGQVPMGDADTSGYGAMGLPAEAIDLVVGRGAALNRGFGPKKGDIVNNNHTADAARIYICRLADIDRDFNIESDLGLKLSEPMPRSAVAIKADHVRLIGREGIKIVTGKIFSKAGGAETNSLGGKISPAPKIDLVAGNNYDNVQGVALGERTAASLTELNALVNKVASAVQNLARIQIKYNAVLGTVSRDAAQLMPVTNLGIKIGVLDNIYQIRTDANLWEINYLTPIGKEYIASTNVRTN